MPNLNALRDLKLERIDEGVTLTAIVAPHCLLHPHSTLEVEVSLGQQVGYLFKQQFVDSVTVDNVRAMLDAVRVVPCVKCDAPALDSASITTNHEGLCEACVSAQYASDYRAYVEAEKLRLEELIVGLKADGRAKGFTHFVKAVLHLEQGDPCPHYFFAASDHAPSIERRIASLGSTITTDYRVEPL